MSPIQLTIGGYGPEESSHGKGLAAFRDSLEASTGGEVAVDVVWNVMSQGRPNTDLIEMVEEGSMFLCYFSTSYLGDRVSELNVLEIPYLFPDLATAHRALDGSLGEMLGSAIGAATGLQTLGFWDNGFRHISNRLRPIHSPEDCVGMSFRVQPNPIHEELVRCWGAVPVAVELSEGIDLIRSGGVDAQENPLANTVAYGVDRVHPFVTMTGHLYGARGLFAHRAGYEQMTEALRSAVDEAARSAIAVQREAAAAGEAVLRDELEAGGVEFVDLDDEGMMAFREAAAPAIALARDLLPEDLSGMVGT